MGDVGSLGARAWAISGAWRAQPRSGPGEGPGGGQGRIRGSHRWVRPARTPAPGTRGRPRGERAPLSDSSCHETRAPEPGKTFGPGPLAPEKGAWSPPFPDVSLLLSLERHLPLVRVYQLPAACVESWLLGCKMGTNEQNPLSILVCRPRKGNTNYPLSPCNLVQLPLKIGSESSKDWMWLLECLEPLFP